MSTATRRTAHQSAVLIGFGALVIALAQLMSASPAGAESSPRTSETGPGGFETGAPPPAALDDSGAVVASSPHVTIRKDGDWTRYAHSSDLEDVDWRTYQGERTERGGCRYSGEETATPTGDVIEEREVANNSRDCTLVTEIGTSSQDSERADDHGQEGYEESSEEAQPTRDAGPVAEGDGFGALATYSAWHRTRYRDPVFLTVNRATTNVTWTSNGSCVTGSSGQTTDYYWLSGSGWSKDSSSTTSSRNCSGATTISNSEFVNGTFCVGGADTHTEYTPNTIKGQPSGNYHMTWSVDKSGGCDWMLHFNRGHGS